MIFQESRRSAITLSSELLSFTVIALHADVGIGPIPPGTSVLHSGGGDGVGVGGTISFPTRN